ncbi:MAG: hypothetical protein HLX52_07160 [Idiomarinaceae bacterium]|uniref:hypothetical protein n=1 Tax=Idiomarina sp. 28-8 TaxID=1260624 RepID=UPI0003063CCD|nr:hypothetical protein [Idiomarina sp. 28-8]NWO02721.1 hypothetical protein [Idiomarinaceae bacterium]
MTHKRDKVYVRFNQGARTGGSSSGNWLSRLLGLFLLLVLIGLGLAFGMVIAAVLFVLMIPVMWRQRHTIKQVWRMRKQAKQHYQEQQRQHQKQQEHYENNQQDRGSVIDGEYEIKDDQDKRS